MAKETEDLTCKARFTVRGTDLDPDDVTRLLGVQPTCISRRGDVTKGGQKRKCGCWIFDSGEPIEDGEKAIEAVVRPFAAKAAELAELRSKGYEVTIWVSHFAFDGGGYVLKPELLGLCSALGASLSVSIIWLSG